MAHSLSAKKRVRQSEKRRARNRFRKDVVKDQVKTFLAAVSAGDLSKAETELRNTARKLDRIATKGTIHKKTAARKRSRLAKRLNMMRAGGTGSAGAGKGTTAAKA
ncbi:MAG TPA: 30S ribosomal protein S20 [Tepidisphaeraceae bacterium]